MVSRGGPYWPSYWSAAEVAVCLLSQSYKNSSPPDEQTAADRGIPEVDGGKPMGLFRKQQVSGSNPVVGFTTVTTHRQQKRMKRGPLGASFHFTAKSPRRARWHVLTAHQKGIDRRRIRLPGHDVTVGVHRQRYL
jgi:hypothetical protein